MAQYSKLDDSQLRRALAMYGEEYDWSTHIDGGAANTSYRVATRRDEQFVLTVLDNDGNLAAETLARLLMHLDMHGVPTGAAIESSNGRLIERLDDHAIMVKRFVSGDCSSILPLEHVFASGAALARVHLIPAPDWLPGGTRRLHEWRETLDAQHDQHFRRWVDMRVTEAQRLLELDETSTIVHGDYFADNLVMTLDNDVAILDWETASRDLPLVDIGLAIVGIACVDGRVSTRRLDAFIRGYESIRELSELENAHLREAVTYGSAVLAYHRYVRHRILWPDPRKHDHYRELQTLADSIASNWPH